jgi:hypothetical protein
VHEYRPDYGIDFTVEIFKFLENSPNAETLGEHLFVQLKSVDSMESKPLELYARDNVEKFDEALRRDEIEAVIDTFRFQLDTPQLVTVERMGIGVPTLLVLAELSTERCFFVCLNDYIDKILIPRHANYREQGSHSIHIPFDNELGTAFGLQALRWYAKRPKLLAAFLRFNYQYAELSRAWTGERRGLATLFGRRISAYDFWDDIEMCPAIHKLGTHLQQFMSTGQPGLLPIPNSFPDDVDPDVALAQALEADMLMLWDQLASLPGTHENIWREWFLPTAAGHLTTHLGWTRPERTAPLVPAPIR